MFGFGFLFSAALGGAIFIGWPIYLHLRKQNQRIQVVPSLRLFGFAKKQTKKIRLQQLLLLLSRVLLILGLCLMLSQPYWETRIDLPLPPVAGVPEGEKILAVILDESVSALHADEEGARLDHAKRHIRTTIKRLPSNCRVIFVPTTCPYPTVRLSKEEALAFLDTVQVIPQQGNAMDAIRNLETVLAGRKTCVVAVTPRSLELWDNLNTLGLEEEVPVNLIDLTDIRTQPYLHSFEDDEVQLGGPPKKLKGMTLEIHSPDGSLDLHQITAHEAIRARVQLRLPIGNGYRRLVLALENKGAWQELFVQPGSGEDSHSQIVILRNGDDDAALVDQLVTAVIQSFNEEARIIHIEPNTKQPLPRSKVLVLAGNPAISRSLRPWFDQQIEAGIRIICIPTSSQATRSQHDFVPSWRRASELTAMELPLRVANRNALPMDNLLLLGLRNVPVSQLIEPTLEEGEQVLTTAGRRTILLMREVNERSTVWAFGFPVGNDPAGPSWHPAFPMLLQHMMFPVADVFEGKTVTVGQAVQVGDWFGVREFAGSLRLPDGKEVAIMTSGSSPVSVAADWPGPYRLSNADRNITRVANYPREEDSRTFSRKDMDERKTGLAVTWADQGVSLEEKDFHAFGKPGTSERRRLDLSPIAFGVMLAFMIMETILLFIVWRREGAIRV